MMTEETPFTPFHATHTIAELRVISGPCGGRREERGVFPLYLSQDAAVVVYVVVYLSPHPSKAPGCPDSLIC